MTYHEEEKIRLNQKLQEQLKKLPLFCTQYFVGMQYKKAPRTRLSYSIDLLSFFEYLKQYDLQYKEIEITDFTIEILNNITAMDIENYLSYIKCYVKNNKVRTNDNSAVKRKLSTLRSFYRYYYVRQLIEKNPTLQVEMPGIEEKKIIRLEMNEMAQLIDLIDCKDNIPFRPSLRIRNMALIMLLLGTGIRVSECVGLDLNDIDFNNNCIKVIRKGGDEDIVYFGDEVRVAILNYYNERIGKDTQEGHEQAFFLSEQHRRLCVRSIQKMVKKYANETVPLKKITPHRLRSTYGTALYQATKDIYIVSTILGHKDVSTTRKHYVDVLAENKMAVRNSVKLR